MRHLMLVAVFLGLSACTAVGLEKRDDGYLKVTVTTWFKSVDGFEAVRDKAGNFTVKFDKTHSGDPIKAANDILDIAERVAGG